MKLPSVYIATNNVKTLYIGVTSDIQKRAGQHAQGSGSTFASKYNIMHIVYVKYADDMETAIAREKQLKGWTQAKKIALIEKNNRSWHDLFIDPSTALRMTSTLLVTGNAK